MATTETKFQRAEAAFEAAHREDPRPRDGETWSLLYHRHLAEWIDRLRPDASEPLRLAARCQHLRRWRIPRSDYPAGKIGYKRWRRDLAQFHADQAAPTLREAGYHADVIERVRSLLLKERLAADPETQALEDAVCLTFLETELSSFAAKHDDEKLKSILRKTFAKMSAAGREQAAGLAGGLPERERGLAAEAMRGL